MERRQGIQEKREENKVKIIIFLCIKNSFETILNFNILDKNISAIIGSLFMLKKIILCFLVCSVFSYSIDLKEFVPFEELNKLEYGKHIRELSIIDYNYAYQLYFPLEHFNNEINMLYVYKVLIDVDKEPNTVLNILLYSTVGLFYLFLFMLSAGYGGSRKLEFPDLSTYHLEYVYNYYFLVFRNDTLYYGGFADDYRKSNDSLINLISKKIDSIM
jgi:hypothetical protein